MYGSFVAGVPVPRVPPFPSGGKVFPSGGRFSAADEDQGTPAAGPTAGFKSFCLAEHRFEIVTPWIDRVIG
jgi:hypothetical protein